jgi:hypothetical protein
MAPPSSSDRARKQCPQKVPPFFFAFFPAMSLHVVCGRIWPFVLRIDHIVDIATPLKVSAHLDLDRHYFRCFSLDRIADISSGGR